MANVATRRKKLTAGQASTMWSSLRGHFVNAEKAIIEIIELKAWEPLGFDTFSEAWEVKMEGVQLTTELLRAHVVYAMFDDELTGEEINEILGLGSRISERGIAELERQKKLGVPPNLARTRRRCGGAGKAAADTVVRSHVRKKPGRKRSIHLQFTTAEYNRFAQIAKRVGMDVSEISAQAVREKFRELS